MAKLTARDKYLRRKFLISEAEYNAQLSKQKGACVCGRLPGTRALAVDHDHAIEKWRVVSIKETAGCLEQCWRAWPEHGVGALYFSETGKTKSEAIRNVKAKLKRLSIRALLCYRCNSGIQRFQDDPQRLRKAAEFLEDYYGKLSRGINDFGK